MKTFRKFLCWLFGNRSICLNRYRDGLAILTEVIVDLKSLAGNVKDALQLTLNNGTLRRLK